MSELVVGSLKGLSANSFKIAVASGSRIVGGGFTASTTITADNASWPVPALGSPWVKVTAIGGGGGGGGAGSGGNGGTGGTTTFDAGVAGTVTALGGLGGLGNGTTAAGSAGRAGLCAGNHGMGANQTTSSISGNTGGGGEIRVAYLNLTGISTVNVDIGDGGTGGTGGNAGGAGGRGEVIVEYVAA
jgi:hypothetical protein